MATVNSLRGRDINRRMQHSVHDEELFMEEALAAIRRAISNDEAGETTLAPAEPRTSREQAGPKPTPEGGFAVPRSNCRSLAAVSLAKAKGQLNSGDPKIGGS